MPFLFILYIQNRKGGNLPPYRKLQTTSHQLQSPTLSFPCLPNIKRPAKYGANGGSNGHGPPNSPAAESRSTAACVKFPSERFC